ncbi:hypothetical protein N7G274_006248 [Stereocaulon virgatum]|uniref:peptidyl-tRNA hydrolase n=1 Tax=Stereocaulon virgatum TaxID=373712 RepID=A0ABR4A4N4_9LECA
MTSIPDRPPPSTVSYVIATAILAISIGYFVGQVSSLGLFSSSRSRSKSTSGKSWPNSYDVTIHPDSSDEELMTHLRGPGGRGVKNSEDEHEEEEEEEEEQGELKAFEGNKEECKLVLIVRTDLGMTKGKIAAQCSHAALACYKYFLSHAPSSPLLKRWERLGQAKIALQVPSEEEMQMLHAQAISLGLCAQVIYDAGRTQIASGSATVLGVGPGPKSVIDKVAGHLKLL